MIKIKRTDNGALLDHADGSTVYAYGEDDLTGLANMLWEICELIGPITSRYSRERISIQIKHGDKYECRDKKCSVCKAETGPDGP